MINHDKNNTIEALDLDNKKLVNVIMQIEMMLPIVNRKSEVIELIADLEVSDIEKVFLGAHLVPLLFDSKENKIMDILNQNKN